MSETEKSFSTTWRTSLRSAPESADTMRSRMRKSGKTEPFPHDSIFHAAAEHRSDLIFLQTDAADRVNGNPDRGAHCPQKLRSSWRKALLAACFIYVAGRYGIGAQGLRAKRFLYGMNGCADLPESCLLYTSDAADD